MNVNVKKTLGSLRFHILALFFGIIMVYPLLWMVASSLKPNEEVFTTATSLIPSVFRWDNYITGWQGNGRVTYSTYFANSFFTTILCTVGSVFSSSLIAYGFARIPFKGKGLLFSILLATTLLPEQILIIPQYVIFQKFGWINTYLPIIIPKFCGDTFFVFLNIQFMKGVPTELDEAAKIDGCGWVNNYTKILLPLSVPSLITSTVFSFYWSWQEFLGPLIYLNDPRKYTVQVALKMFSDPQTNTNWAGLFAMSTLSILPVIIVFLFCQKYLVEGVATTGIKQ